MKFQTTSIAVIVLLVTLASTTQGHLLKSLIKKKLLALPSVVSSIAGLKASISGVKQINTAPAIQETTIRFAGQLDTVAVPAPFVHLDTVVAPAPVVHVNKVVVPPPVVHVNKVVAPAPVVHLDTIVVPELDHSYAPYYSYHETPVYYKEVHPVSKTVHFSGEVHKATLGDSHSGSVQAVGSFGLDIKGAATNELSSWGSAAAQFNYASDY